MAESVYREAQEADAAPLLDIGDLHKYYGATAALCGVSLRVEAGAIVCLLGPSGCGKTTLLRVIAGLERAERGTVRCAGRSIDGLPPHLRGFGLMFQDYALFPHRDVAENVAFGLRMQNLPRERIAARVAEMLALVGLEGYDPRRVYELSGGERQRVALARSLAPSPRLLMLDEPLGALDRALRERLLDDLRAILKRVGVTSIYVTHDQAEAFAIADWLVLLNSGRVEQQGRPEAVYRRPATTFAARFMGLTNLIAGRVLGQESAGAVLVDSALGPMRAAGSAFDGRAAAPVTLVIRPEAAEMLPAGDRGQANVIHGSVAERSFRGSRTRLTVRHTSGQALEFELDGAQLPDVGEPIALRLRAEAISLLPICDRRRDLVDLFPQFLMRRRQRWAGLQALLEASGLARPEFFLLRAIVEEAAPGLSMSDAELRANLFNPYSTFNPIFESLPALADKGCLAKVGELYTVTPRGRTLIEQAERAARAYLATLAPPPPADLMRLADTLTGIAGRVWSASEPVAKPHQARMRRLASTKDSPPLVRLEAAVYALWMARDDAHMAAWRSAGFDGPTIELLSQLWTGAADSLTGLIEQVRQYQRPEDVEGGVAVLIRAGYVAAEGDRLQLTPDGRKMRNAIEAETDRIYFTPWPSLTLDEVEWLYETFQALCEVFGWR